LDTYVRCFTGLEGLKELKPEWQALFAEAENPSFYNDWRWHHAIQSHLCSGPVYYFTIYQKAQLVALIPLTVSKQKRMGMTVRYLTFPYDTPIDAADCLVKRDFADASVFIALLGHLMRHPPEPWDILELSHFADRSATHRLVGRHARAMALGTAYVKQGPTGDLVSPLSKKQVKNTRRHLKNAGDKYGLPHFQPVTDPALIEEAYDTFLTVEAASWKGEHGTQSAIRLRPSANAFYLEVLSAFSETGSALINLLRFNDTPVAAQIGLRTGEQLSLLKIGFDERFRDVGPGGITLLHCLEAEQSRSQEVNLVTNPPWASRWHFSIEQKWSATYFNKTIIAQALHLLWKVQAALKALRSRGRRNAA
jgi:CelD/BcsL family acetyltransferase involved in cellulose biosynthesis